MFYLLHLEAGVKKVLFTSSVAAIGPETENNGLISENTEFSIYDRRDRVYKR